MRGLFVILLSALCATTGLLTNVAEAAQPTAVTIEIESIDALLSSVDMIGKGAGLPVNRQMVEGMLMQAPIFDMAALDVKKPIRVYLSLPDMGGAQPGGPKPPGMVMVLPVPSGGAGIMNKLKTSYGSAQMEGKTLHLTQPKPEAGGAPPYLFAEVIGTSAFLASDATALKATRERYVSGKALADMPKLIGVIKVAFDIQSVWPTLKQQITASTANMPESVPASPGMPKGMNPKKVLGAEIDLFDALIKDVVSYGIGLKPRANTLDFYSRFDVKPGSTLARTMISAGAKPNRYAKILPTDGYFTMVSGGLNVWQEFMEPYSSFMETLLGGTSDAATGANAKNMMTLMQSALGQYAGDLGLSVVPNPGGGGIGFVEYFHLKNPAQFESDFDKIIAKSDEMYKDIAPGFSMKKAEAREHNGAKITGMSYSMKPPEGAAADPASAMMLSAMSQMTWEYAVVGQDLVYTMGGPEYMNLAIDRLKAPAGVGFMASKPFVSLIPQVKATPTGAFSLSLVPMLKNVLKMMPNAQEEMLNAIPDQIGGIAGFSFQQGNSAAGVARLSYSEITSLVSSGQIIGGMVTQMMMGGMVQGAGAAAQPVPANRECRRNLGMIDGAKQQYGMFDAKLKAGDPVDAKGMSMYFPGGKMPSCPEGGTYTVGTFGQPPKCSHPGHGM